MSRRDRSARPTPARLRAMARQAARAAAEPDEFLGFRSYEEDIPGSDVEPAFYRPPWVDLRAVMARVTGKESLR